MSGIDPPSNLLKSALEAEKSRPEPPARMRDHVLVRVVASATIAAAAGAAAGTAEAAGGAAGAIADQATGAGVVKGGLLSAKVIALVVASFAGGTATGAGLHAVLTTPPAPTAPSAIAPRVVSAPPTASSAAKAPEEVPDAAPPASHAALEHGPAPIAPNASTTGSGQDSDLSSERAIIEQARTALMRGQAAAALDTLALHARKYPRGRLSQEREVLTIHALVAVGRRPEAVTRADRFRQRHPNSPMLAAIDAVLPPTPASSASR